MKSPNLKPFVIDSPTCISFSGGRTSGYMLYLYLLANGGLPKDAIVCFANTGKEDEATLRFVDRCAKEWGVPIHWIEWDQEKRVREVYFDSACRNGEPFEALIRKKSYLPNPVTRFCTSELKIRPMHFYLKSLGFDELDMATGIRADEQRRVAKIRGRGTSSESKNTTMVLPLADAGIVVRDVGEFWKSQSFDLELPNRDGKTLEGNCDLCFLKGAKQILSLIQKTPHKAEWWARMETIAKSSSNQVASGAVFRSDRPSYQQMAKFTQDQADMFGFDDQSIECFCGD